VPGWAAGAAIAGAGAAAALLWFRSRRREEEFRRFAVAAASGDLSARCPGADTASAALNVLGAAFQGRLSAVEAERDRLAGVLDSLGEGVVALDAQRRVVLANRSAGRLLGFGEAGVVGRPFWELVRQDGLLGALAEVQANGRAASVQVGPLCDRLLGVSVAPIPDGPRPAGLALVVQDTTESSRYQDLRREFVGNVSHELRTPLTLIRGFVETLKEGAILDPVKGPEFLDVIDKHSRQLSHLVEDLLDLSRLESPQGLIRRVRVDLSSLLARVLDLQAAAAQRKAQSLTLDVEAGLPAVPGDPDYLERAVANLVDNAVKYTPERGSVRVRARRVATGVEVEVEDDGIGIPEKDLPRIWERFYRVDKSRSRDMGGTGLGLAIVKHVVQAHGGTIDARSAPGRGSTFRVRLPAVPA
jgi:two-component system phosphate regulon sensor histidine kinase PhoR